MAACSIFEEDEVCIPTSSGGFKYGLVVESSQYLSSDEEDDDDEDRVRRGTVKVAWHPNGEETVLTEKKVILADRSLVPGDVVRRLISGKESQRGFVQDNETKCHIKILGTEQFIYNVDARDIRPLQEWDPEPEVTMDSWVGHVLEVHEDLTVRFSDGARCCLGNAGRLSLEDINDKRKHYSEFVMRNFYPGQEVCGTSEDFEDAKWLQASSTRGPGKTGTRALYGAPVVVEKVETSRVDVRWICKGFTKTGGNKEEKLETPPSAVQGDKMKDMRQLDCFQYSHLQVGDKGYYVVKDDDVLLRNMSPRQHATPDIVELMSHDNLTVLGTSADSISVVRGGQHVSKSDKDKTNTDGNLEEKRRDLDNAVCGDDEFEDVDESNEESDASTEAVGPMPRRKNRKRPILHTKNLKRVLGKKAKRKQKLPEREVKAGDKVPIEVWYTFSRCTVVWQDGTVEAAIPSPELFPIHHLDELEFFPGDFVIDSKDNLKTDYGVVVSCDHKERTVMVKWIKPYNPGNASKPEESSPVELSVYDVKDHMDYKFRPGHTVIRVGGYENEMCESEAVGQVFRLNPDGTIAVWWPNKTISKCYPQELYIISEEFQSELGSTDGWSDEEEEEEEEDEGSDVSWETEEETDADTEDDDARRSKQLWSFSDEKKKDLDELLKRVQAALSGLLEVFVNIPGPFFKNSYQVFHDILTIFKRCKEMEKILKSSYFDDDDIADLISEVKEELRREKTAKLARHVAEVHKYRSSMHSDKSFDRETVVSRNRHVDGVSEKGDGEKAGSIVQSEETEVEGATCKVDDSDAATERLRKALTEFGSNIEDPLLQIIFDTSLHVTVAKTAQKSLEHSLKRTLKTDACSDPEIKASEIHENGKESQDVCANGIDADTSGKKGCSVEDVIETVIKAVCEKDSVLDKELQEVREKIRMAYDQVSPANDDESGKGLVDSQKMLQKSLSNGTDAESAKDSSADVQTQLMNGGLSKCTAKGTKSEENLSSSHRTLCIRVCKALNARLMFIQQEVNRRWLAFKFGWDESDTDADMFKKMQDKMIESIDSGRGPLRLDSDLLNGETRAVDVGNIIVPELDSAEGSKSSLSGELEGESEEVDASKAEEEAHRFEVCSEAPDTHWFKFQEHKPDSPKSFNTAIRKEMVLLRSSLPDGILVKGFEDRMDLYSVLIKGPSRTPYEDGLFSFDVQLPASFPSSPPVFHYLSFCNERLNPNLYEDGKVCVSLLGTWSGKGNEVWTSKSSLLQVLVSIQGLILVPEPYFNEAGYEKQKGSQLGQENSRMYNEMAILKMVQSMTNMTTAPPVMFEKETRSHLENNAKRMVARIQAWIDVSEKQRAESLNQASTSDQSIDKETCDRKPCDTVTSHDLKPEFPLLPASKGFCLTMKKILEMFKKTLAENIFKEEV